MAKQEVPAIFKKWWFWVLVVLVACIIGFSLKDANEANRDAASDAKETEVVPSGYTEGAAQYRIEQTIRERAKEQYEATTIDSILIYDETEDGVDNYTVTAYLTFDRTNKPDTAQPVVDMYADDLAAWVGKEQSSVDKVYVYWRLPNIVGEKTGTGDPYMIYDRTDGGMAITDKNWPF